ncbi:MAG: class I SAM-dependent methyltransferase [Gammaproteobacteria bacterium]|nr:class I SAM-dependent methyltransferase [Gammaproteobacteria bacterium]
MEGESCLELGAGDCRRMARLAAPLCSIAYVLDFSPVIVEGGPLPANCPFPLSTGCDIPVLDSPMDVAYSNQLVEHLHPDNAVEQLRSIFRVLKKCGRYACVMPNRVSGPRDISMHFDETATGSHLKKYRAVELRDASCRASFPVAHVAA